MVTYLPHKKNRSSIDNLLKGMVNFINRFIPKFQIVNPGKLYVKKSFKNQKLLFSLFFKVFF